MDSRQQKRKGTEIRVVIGRCWYAVIPSSVIYALSVDVIEKHDSNRCRWYCWNLKLDCDRKTQPSSISQQRGTQNQITHAFIGLALLSVVIINIIAVRYNQKYDFTKQQRYTLSEQSISILKDINPTIKTYGQHRLLPTQNFKFYKKI